MQVILQKWGNSIGIRIPSAILKSLNLKNDDKLDLIQTEDKIVITKSKSEHLTFEERVKRFESLKNDEKGCILPYDFGEDVGNEIWN